MEIGKENPNIFFTDCEGRRNTECLSWGIDKERVLKEKSAIESVAFTGAPLFVIAAIWFVGFGLSLLLLCLCCCCCQRRYYGYSQTAYVLSLIFLTFTIAAIIGCVVLYTGQGKFHTSTSNTLDYVVWQANTTVENLGSVLDYLEAAKHIRVDQLFLPPDVQNNINKIRGDTSHYDAVANSVASGVLLASLNSGLTATALLIGGLTATSVTLNQVDLPQWFFSMSIVLESDVDLEAAHEKSQKYKEGKFILERFKILGPDGSHYMDQEAQIGGSDPDDA